VEGRSLMCRGYIYLFFGGYFPTLNFVIWTMFAIVKFIYTVVYLFYQKHRALMFLTKYIVNDHLLLFLLLSCAVICQQRMKVSSCMKENNFFYIEIAGIFNVKIKIVRCLRVNFL
jgi:hypothetical protein